ncbi:MAG: Maf family protein [Eubacteriales bacterium]|nr:Maf family protein [Eubacteriales bacterium]
MHKNNEHRLILASASPRRRELMEKLGRGFEVELSDADEAIPEGLPVEEIPEFLSFVKAEAVMKRHNDEDAVVIGSDTIVELDGVIYGKPGDNADAFRMLRALSGRTHRVMTGVTLLRSVPGTGSIISDSFVSITEVTFYDLSDEEIDQYIATGEPADKAGAYGIQGQGAMLVEKISGDYYTVVGFPIAEIGRRLNVIESVNEEEQK